MKTSPVRSISFTSAHSLGAKFTAMDKDMTEYTYAGREGETYIRVEATDCEGRTAWSNPIFLE